MEQLVLSLRQRKNVYALILGLFLISFPQKAIFGSLSSILLTLFFFIDNGKRINFKIKLLIKNKVFKLFFCFFMLQVFGLLWTNNLDKGFKEIIQLLPIIGLPITLLTEDIDKKQVEKALTFFKYFIISELFILLSFQLFNYGRVFTFEHETFSILKVNPFYFSAVLYFNIIIIMFQLKKEHFRNIILYLELIFFVFFMLLLSARICILITIFSLIYFLMLIF